jgi:predicted RND superfamily exporter protein
MFRLPEKFFPPFIIEPVMKQSRVRMPYRVTSKIMMNYLSPPATAKTVLSDSQQQQQEQQPIGESDPNATGGEKKERRLADSSIDLSGSSGALSKRTTLSDSEASVETLPTALAYVKVLLSSSSSSLLSSLLSLVVIVVGCRCCFGVCFLIPVDLHLVSHP